ncbi:response regulator [Pontibacter qinzhouensis]|uniref:histidine kinase n=1 Tax=Pontibacter qinzhouensis TaxID=2603253 RepID=A0A5C8KES1_9BACT|nr:response regulator [Pontibacter qinzhouensis]TXK52164.1 response regulator [Pontibacter qinzhouensis]
MKVLKERIEDIISLIAEVANGNFDYQIEATETGDELDAIISGISMLGQELKSSTVSRDFMQSIYQGVVDMLVILNPDLTVRAVNEAFEELLDLKEEEVAGQQLADLVHPNDALRLQAAYTKFKAEGKCLNVELLLQPRHRQNPLPVSCSFSYLKNSQKEIDGILIIAKDITEIKRTEQELKEAKNKAEAANEAKSNFLSSMSHEIRTPLNGIMGFTDLLMQTDLNKSQKQYLNLIKTSGSTLTKLLSDILDLHRIEQDKISLELIPFDLRTTASANLEPYKHLAQAKKVAFSYTFDEAIPEIVIGDPNRINQVLINLVSNAIKFTENGAITIHHRVDKIDQENLLLTCTVTDTGVGIPAAKQAIIFDSFTQSDQSTSRRYGGFGLGLTISKKLVAILDGELGVVSPPPGKQQGSSFWFTVKLQAANNQPEDTSADLVELDFRLEKEKKILVVDDNEINIFLMQDILENFGATVTTALSGEEAITLAHDTPFDIIFMDIQMPDIDGLEATAELRKAGFTGTIIAFSANAYKDDIYKSLAAGMNDHLCKPFTQEDLIALLTKWG